MRETQSAIAGVKRQTGGPVVKNLPNAGDVGSIPASVFMWPSLGVSPCLYILFLFFFKFIYLIYFIFGCIGSSLLRAGFL